MVRRVKFAVVYAPEVARHVGAIEGKYYGLIRRAVDAQLSFTPCEQTRNRKPLEVQPGPFESTWELRCGPGIHFRVFYEVVLEKRQVWILAIGVKDRDRLLFAGEELES